MKNEQPNQETAYEKLQKLAISLVSLVLISIFALVLGVKYGVNIPMLPIFLIVLGCILMWGWGPRKNTGLIFVIIGLVGLFIHWFIDAIF